MGSSDLRAAFADVVGPTYSVEQALLFCERDEAGKEWQVLRFRGNGPDGAFDYSCARHSPNADPVAVARETATQFLSQRQGQPP
jgi:hypothetical protein